jgi:hypothetical protein
MSLIKTNSPTWGSFVLTIATRAANTGVKGKEEAWARMTDRLNSPFPRIKFSPNSSGTTCLIFDTLTYPSVPIPKFSIIKAYLIDHTIYTLSQSVPAQSLIFRTSLILCRFRLHSPQPRRGYISTSSPRSQHLCEFRFSSCILILL